MKKIIKKNSPYWIYEGLRQIRHPQEIKAEINFLIKKNKETTPYLSKLNLIKKIALINTKIECAHTQAEILQILESVLYFPKNESGVIVEAGCYKGGSSAKISHAAFQSNREFFIFDSFEGIPENHENHGKNIFRKPASFSKGDYAGAIDEVKKNIEQYGNINSCEFIKGWFDDTLPSFNKPVSVAYIDVDLVSSTRTCIKHLYPLLSKSGIIFSQDGHLPLIINLLKDEGFWLNDVGVQPPKIEGLGHSKLIKIFKS